jgi:alkylation response protein AidB-like acyl-CoA dehydrogenase
MTTMAASANATDVIDEPAELAAYRQQVHAWLAANAARRRVRADGEEEDDVGMFADQGEDDVVTRAKAFQAKLFDAGYAAITWPKDIGGQGLTNDHQRVFNEEAAAYEMPTGGIYTIGLGMVAPTLLEFGTDEQKDRYLPKLLRGEEIWSQLFSEPGAGSDVASLQTKAVRDGDEWVITGQKVWTSGAHYSDYGAIIARTDPEQPKHRGISMFIVDMRDPRVTIKPLRQITGGANFNEVFFDDVRIPAANLIGPQNEGWRCAIAMLMNERVAIGAGGGGARRGAPGGLDSLINLAKANGLDHSPVVRQGLADLYIRQTILGYIGLRIRSAAKAGRAPGPEGSIAKLSGALLARRSSDLALQIAGAAGIAWPEGDDRGSRWAMASLSAPASAIAGGTNEVQRNIIGERVLGLPKEPQVDRDMPFKELKVGTQRD